MFRRRAFYLLGLCLFAIPATFLLGSSVSRSCKQSDIPYGSHPAQKLDLYTPCGQGAVPAVVFIHGGGWWSGDKAFVSKPDIDYFLSRRIAVASINYRNLIQAKEDGLFPPLYGPLVDARSAVAFLQTHGAKLHIAADRMSAYGGSAGGFSALWVGLGSSLKELPDLEGRLPEIMPLRALGGIDAQTTIDPAEMHDWVGDGIAYGGHAFGLPEGDFDSFLRNRDQYQKYIPKLSPSHLIGADSPPIYLIYSAALDSGATDHSSLVHSPHFGIRFKELAENAGADVAVSGNAKVDASVIVGLRTFLADSLGDERE